MRTIFCFIGIFPWLLNPTFHSSPVQTSQPDVSHTLKINDKLHLDSKMTEWRWQTAARISNFTQQELNEGELATERTEVAAVCTTRSLYLGWCYDREPNKIVAREMKRDFNSRGEDHVEIVIDTNHDRRNVI